MAYFCVAEGKPIWICSDIRHKRDYKWFLEFYPDRIRRIRVFATEDIRKSRGWIFTQGIDDGPSECGLDDITDWDLIVTNNGATSLDSYVDTVYTYWSASVSK